MLYEEDNNNNEEYDIKDENNNKNKYFNASDYITIKEKMIRENTFRKFTFFKNTIVRYVYKNGKLVPFKEEKKIETNNK